MGMLRRVEWETQDWARLSTWASAGESGRSPDRPEERAETTGLERTCKEYAMDGFAGEQRIEGKI